MLDIYIVEYQYRNAGTDSLDSNTWQEGYKTTNVHNVIKHLAAMHNNQDAIVKTVRVIRKSSLGREVIKF